MGSTDHKQTDAYATPSGGSEAEGRDNEGWGEQCCREVGETPHPEPEPEPEPRGAGGGSCSNWEECPLLKPREYRGPGAGFLRSRRRAVAAEWGGRGRGPGELLGRHAFSWRVLAEEPFQLRGLIKGLSTLGFLIKGSFGLLRESGPWGAGMQVGVTRPPGSGSGMGRDRRWGAMWLEQVEGAAVPCGWAGFGGQGRSSGVDLGGCDAFGHPSGDLGQAKAGDVN